MLTEITQAHNLLSQCAASPLPAVTFADLLDLAVTQIRQYEGTDLAVTLRLIQVLTEVARVAMNPQQRTFYL